MPEFRKKPVVIEAKQLSTLNAIHLAQWCGGEHTDDATGCGVNIPTLEGTMRASEGDWIIKGVHGEFYPCKPDIFEATYEPA